MLTPQNKLTNNKLFIGILVPYLVLISVIFIWGISFPITKELENHLSATAILFYRVFFAFIFSLIFLKKKRLRNIKKPELKIILIVGILQIFGCLSFITYGLQYVLASRAVFIAYTTPLFVIPMSIVIKKYVLKIKDLVGVLVGGIGLYYLFKNMGISSPQLLIGVSLLLSSSFCWSLAIILIRNMDSKRDNFIGLLPYQLAIALFCLLVLIHRDISYTLISLNTDDIGKLLFLSIFATAYGFWASTYLSYRLASHIVSASFMLVPICGAGSSYILLGEVLTKQLILSQSLILIGVCFIIVNFRSSKNG